MCDPFNIGQEIPARLDLYNVPTATASVPNSEETTDSAVTPKRLKKSKTKQTAFTSTGTFSQYEINLILTKNVIYPLSYAACLILTYLVPVHTCKFDQVYLEPNKLWPLRVPYCIYLSHFASAPRKQKLLQKHGVQNLKIVHCSTFLVTLENDSTSSLSIRFGQRKQNYTSFKRKSHCK